jgi:hypothetical protein
MLKLAENVRDISFHSKNGMKQPCSTEEVRGQNKLRQGELAYNGVIFLWP